MDDFLAHRTAVITGAASGLGLSIATRLAEHGARVILSDIRADAAQYQAATLSAQGLAVEAFAADASAEESVEALIAFALERLGSVDILVNNAGLQHVAPIESFPVEKFRQLVDVMLIGPFISTKCVFPSMKRQQFGRIINIASINGLIGFAGKAAYNAAKHGLIGLTRVTALEGASFGITVNALCPGYADTPLVRNQFVEVARQRGVSVEDVLGEVIYPLVPQRRLLDPEEIADYAAFLASDQARGVTGQAVVIDGGYVAQ